MPRIAPIALLALALAVAACDSSSTDQTGDRTARASDTVTVDYVGTLDDGRVFDRSTSPATFPLQDVVDGFRDGIVGMRVGETKTFRFEGDKGYGANPPRGSIIPPNAALTFVVTLRAIR